MVDSYDIDRDSTVLMQRKWDSSKPKCFWHSCRVRVDREDLFCSTSCKNKAMSWDGWDNVHRLALACYEPDPSYLDAHLVDGGLWHTRIDPIKGKRLKHAKKWHDQWAPIFSRYRGALPPRKGLEGVNFGDYQKPVYRPQKLGGGLQFSHNVHTDFQVRRF